MEVVDRIKVVCIVGLVLMVVQSEGVEGLGVNWGTQATHMLPPKTVVQMLKDNAVSKVKLFDAAAPTMSALAGSSVDVMVAIPNDQLAAINDYSTAQNWVTRNISVYDFNGGVSIKYVAVGNEPFLSPSKKEACVIPFEWSAFFY